MKDFLGCALGAGVLAFSSDFRRLGAYIYDPAATRSLTYLRKSLCTPNINIVALGFVRFGGRQVYHHRHSGNGLPQRTLISHVGAYQFQPFVEFE